MKPLVIYHADCTDGFGAAFAAWLKLGDEAIYWPAQYNTKTQWPLGEMVPNELGDVYILDFSFPRETMELIFQSAKRVVWRDHHKTAFEMWCGTYASGMQHDQVGDIGSAEIDIFLDDNKSGALLAWEYFHPNTEVPLLIQHIDDRDRWQWKLEGSAEIHAFLGSMKPWSFEQWAFYTRPSAFEGMRFSGEAILRAQKQHVERMAKQARKCAISVPSFVGQNCADTNYPYEVAIGLAVNAPIHQSEVGHELANASGTYGLVWYVASDNRIRCSLRSNGKYDVSAIARTFGGGGHRNAAGFETDIETLMEWLK